jgi:starch synthase
VGIVNGLDYEEWDPARDPVLARRYDVTGLEGRIENRRALEKELGMSPGTGPLVVMVSRLDRQKGIQILPEVIRQIASHPTLARIVILGSGDAEHTRQLRLEAAKNPGRVVAVLDRFDNELAHRMYAGGDILLMPSLFEPCGLAQLIAMRYGCIPVVRATGGLADTVEEGATGFRFDAFDATACAAAVDRALVCRQREPGRWAALQRGAMGRDWSWTRSARAYSELYQRTLSLSRSAR